jgi:predicted CXXCH cytochrome family protein
MEQDVEVSMMVNGVVGHSKGTKKVSDRISRALLGMLLWSALLGGCAALSAQEPKPPEKSVPAVKLHDPLAGKECVDCHKRVEPQGVRCLLGKDDFCDFCHKVPVEGGVARLVETSEPLCFACHKKDSFKGSFVHGPFAAGACITCHNPHGGSVPGMLRATGPQMCLECHNDMHPSLANADFRHKAALTGCTDCHSPHASEQRYMLTSAIPGLCGKCHEKTVNDLQTAKVKHSPVTEDPACMNCHNPHAAQESGLLIADELDVCLKCHDKTVKDKDEKQEFADMKKLLAANPFPHGPILNRDCSGCHDSHGSPYFRLLTDQYPQGFYAPFFISNYDLCFRCHDAALVTEERTTSATDFRDGDRNLHFVHVDKTSHGRTCRSCHVVHASANPQHIAETVRFGNWELPIQYEKTDNGGSCTPGCHALQKYSRQTAKQEKQ